MRLSHYERCSVVLVLWKMLWSAMWLRRVSNVFPFL